MRKQRHKKQGLVSNVTPPKEQELVSLTLNFLPKSCRVDNLEGQDYTVIPMVILTEGVHAGSMGPLYYPKDELSKTPQVWNHKPVVVYHPTMNGVGVSACDPVVINSRKVGLMMNTKWQGGKLKSEAWIRKDRAEVVDDRIMAAVASGEMMELSTGVFVDVEQEGGKFQGEDYVGVARNYRPDHLALLPDQIGACSIADGAGFLRNAQSGVPKTIPQQVMQRMLERAGFASNELSHSDISVSLGTALRERFGKGLMNHPTSVWVMDVFSNFVVYDNNGTLFRLSYTSNDTEVRLSDDDPAEVVRVSEYRTVQNTQQQDIMNPEIKKLVDAIVGNAAWAKDDLEQLGKLPKEQLEALGAMKKANPAFTLSPKEVPATNADPAPAPAPAAAPQPAPAPVANAAQTPAPAKPASVNEYIAAAPKEVQEVLNNGLQAHNEEKASLVAAIAANANNAFSAEELNTKPLNELRKMARLMGAKPATDNRTPNYAGQAPTAPTENAEECLVMPTINFGKKTAA